MTLTADVVDDLLVGLDHFLDVEVERAHRGNAWLNDRRAIFTEDGRYTGEVLELVRDIRMRSAAAGYYTMALPAEVGGADLGYQGIFRAWEAVLRRCGTLHWLGHHVLAHWSKGPSPLLLHLAPEVRERYLPDLISGRTSMCFAMSEPDAGSDIWMMRTSARRVADGWMLSGGKQWISNGAGADLSIVFAVTDRAATDARKGGITAFLVPATSAGFHVAGVSPMFGHAGSNEGILYFDDVVVPDDHVLGEVGNGLPLAMEGISLGRMYNCAKATGLAGWALGKALTHVKQRRTFGAPIASHQAVTFPLAESAIDIQGARLLSLDCARMLDEGENARVELAMAKVFATERCLAAVDKAMQVHGAAGFTNDLGLAEAWQMLRVVCVADGSAEILRRQIAKSLLAGSVGP